MQKIKKNCISQKKYRLILIKNSVFAAYFVPFQVVCVKPWGNVSFFKYNIKNAEKVCVRGEVFELDTCPIQELILSSIWKCIICL